VPRIFQPRKTTEGVLQFRRQLGQAIRAWREERACLSRTDLAASLGCSAKTIERWEAGLSCPRMEDIYSMEGIAAGLTKSATRVLMACVAALG
jgi:ribosome-binding protein aMBF1 (putative translation factor)